MGRYVYNSGQVTQAIDRLNEAIKAVADVNTEIQVGIDEINNATGASCIEIDYSKLLQLQPMAEEVIEEDIRTIQSKVTVIEDYENAPWYKKVFSSVGMALTKFVEGVASGLENICDGAVSIVGFVGGIFNSDFKNSVAEYVAKDHVGDWFQEKYDNGFLKGVASYSYFSEHSTAANIFKGFGTAAPYIALSMTGVGTTIEVAAAALGGIGSGTEAGINKALANDPNITAGQAFNSAFGQGVMQGAKNAALVYAMNKISQYAANKANTPRITDGTNPGQGLTTSEKIFSKTHKLAETPAGQAINQADDVVKAGLTKTGSAISKVGSKLPGAKTVGKIWDGITKNGVTTKVVNGVKNVVKAHPGTAYTTAATVFALDQVDEDVINSTKREQDLQVGVATRTPLPITPDPTQPYNYSPVPTTPTQTPSVSVTPSQTPQQTPTQTPQQTYGGGGGGGYTTPTPTVTVAVPTQSPTVEPTQQPTTQPTPTQTSWQPQPTYTSTSYNPDPTPTSGGGGYNEEEGYTGEDPTDPNNQIVDPDNDFSSSGNAYTNIPTSAAPITTTTTTGAKKSIIPVIAGLGAATVAGLGTKALLDKKEESYEEDDSFEADEWVEEDSINVDYEEAMEEDSDYLSPSDEYAYSEEEPESYEAVNSSELASMQ